jgi:hypothetical protein
MARRTDPFVVDLTPELIIRAYCAGIFPMSEDAEDEDIFWVSPDLRGIIPLDGFRASKSLRKAMRKTDWTIRVDTDWDGVIHACATVGEDRDTTWINGTIRDVYGELFRRGVNWLAAFMGWPLARRSSGNQCSIGAPTPQRWPWRISSTASMRVASNCSTPSSSPIISLRWAVLKSPAPIMKTASPGPRRSKATGTHGTSKHDYSRRPAPTVCGAPEP